MWDAPRTTNRPDPGGRGGDDGGNCGGAEVVSSGNQRAVRGTAESFRSNQDDSDSQGAPDPDRRERALGPIRLNRASTVLYLIPDGFAPAADEVGFCGRTTGTEHPWGGPMLYRRCRSAGVPTMLGQRPWDRLESREGDGDGGVWNHGENARKTPVFA